jgi:hypothetical protein
MQLHTLELILVLLLLCLSYSSSVATVSAAARSPISVSSSLWKSEAIDHIQDMDFLLYPPGKSLKERTHLVKQHPIYNFIHTYYRYSTQNVKKYSPGLDIVMKVIDIDDDRSHLNQKYLKSSAEGYYYELPREDSPTSKFGWISLSKTRDLLHSTANKQPFYGCFGLHEWAMLYSGRRDTSKKTEERHQKELPLRVSQEVIDAAVESSNALKCTHYDAFRFFHPAAQPLNAVSMMTRDFQKENEQPGMKICMYI